MRDFFKPSRQKIGVVTLGLACVFTAGWVRSYSLVDGYGFHPTQDTVISIGSMRGRIWGTIVFASSGYLLPASGFCGTRALTADDQTNLMEGAETKWGFGGFEFGTFEFIKAKLLAVPYWSLTVPLTLFSAYLLLSKPRQASAVQSTEPAPTTGA